MSLQIRRYLLALTLGAAGITLAIPLTHTAVAFAEDGASDDGVSGPDHQKAVVDDHGSADNGLSNDDGADGEGDDDAGAVGGASKGKFQEGCAITDVKCLDQTAK
jgi:hypothetical protein